MPLASADLDRLLLAVAATAGRTVPVAWLIPAFGGPSVPAPIRLGVGVALGLLALPHAVEDFTRLSTLAYALVFGREVAVGVTLGFAGAAVFRAAEAAGRLVDVARGANLSEVLSPFGEERSSPLAAVYLLLTVVIFFEIGGVGHVATALARSYEAVPLGGAIGGGGLTGAVELVVVATARILQSSVGLAAPGLVSLFLADLVLGALARLAPQIPVYFTGMPLKALAGVGIVLLGLGGLQAALTEELRVWASTLVRAIAVWQ